MKSKENLMRAIKHDNPEWVPNGMESVFIIGPPVVERPSVTGKDSFGVQWSLEEGAQGGTYPSHVEQAISDIAQWREQICIPDINGFDWGEIARQASSIDRELQLVCGFVEMGLFERSYLLFGVEAALVGYLTEPREMERMIGAIADYKIALIEKFDDVAQLEMVWYGDDWGTQENLFIPPQTWRTVIKPHTQRIYDCMKKRGIIINQHSCGRIEEIFEDIVAMGADVWNPCQPCNDLAGLKRRFQGKIAFCGGIDSQFVLDKKGVTCDEVNGEVRRRIEEMAYGGGYIAAPSHSVPYDRSILEAMNNAIRKYGRMCYAQVGDMFRR